MDTFIEFPSVETIVSSTAPTATSMFNAMTPFVWFAIGVSVAVAVALLLMKAISGAVHYLKDHSGSATGLSNMNQTRSYDDWVAEERSRGYKHFG